MAGGRNYILDEEMVQLTKWVCKIETGTGFICKDCETEKVYIATACHVLLHNIKSNKENIKEETILNNYSESINVYINNQIIHLRERSSAHSFKKYGKSSFCKIKLKNLIKQGNEGLTNNAKLISLKFDIALIPINLNYELEEGVINFSQTAFLLNLRLRAGDLLGPILIIQFPGQCLSLKWEESQNGPFELGFDMGYIEINKDKKYKMIHNASTLPGSSGSPIIQLHDNNIFVVGVHTGAMHCNNNRFTLISEAIFISKYIDDCTKAPNSLEDSLQLLCISNPPALSSETSSQAPRNAEFTQESCKIPNASNAMINPISTQEIVISEGVTTSGVDEPETSQSTSFEGFDMHRSKLNPPMEGLDFFRSRLVEHPECLRPDSGGYSPIFSYNLYLQAANSFVMIEDDVTKKKICSGIFAKFDGFCGLLIPLTVPENKLENSVICIRNNNRGIPWSSLKTDQKPIILFDYVQILKINFESISVYGITSVKIAPHVPYETGSLLIGSDINNKVGFQTVQLKKYFDKQEQEDLSSVSGNLIIENENSLTWPCLSFSCLFQVHGSSTIELVGITRTNGNLSNADIKINFLGIYVPSKGISQTPPSVLAIMLM